MSTSLDPVRIARELVRIPSESSRPVGQYPRGTFGEAEVMRYLFHLAQKYSIDGELDEVLPDRPNLYLRLPQKKKPKLLFDIHMDTVSASNMVIEPFSGEIREEKLWGRGACDVKGPAGALMAAICGLTRQNKAIDFDLTIAFTIDEECSFAGSKRVREVFSHFDFAIAMEPTGFRIITAHKGVYRFRAVSTGKAVHSSRTELGDNAIYKMVPVLQNVQQLAEDFTEIRDDFLGSPTISANCIHGGTSFNIIPDRCEMEIDCRYLPEMKWEEIRSALRKNCSPEIEFQDILMACGFRNDTQTQWEKKLIAAHRPVSIATERTGVAFGTDCSEISSLAPCIVWGPGNIEQAHTKDEHIQIKELYFAEKILMRFLSVG